MNVHETHNIRISDSSMYDERCTLCGMTDGTIMGRAALERSCPNAVKVIATVTAASSQVQLWSKEHDYLHKIGSPGLRWVMLGFFNLPSEAKEFIEAHQKAVDSNGHQEVVVKEWRIIPVQVFA